MEAVNLFKSKYVRINRDSTETSKIHSVLILITLVSQKYKFKLIKVLKSLVY